MFPESKALTRFETPTPLLVLPSHDWQVPDASGQVGGTCTGRAASMQDAGRSCPAGKAPAPVWFIQQAGRQCQRSNALSAAICHLATPQLGCDGERQERVLAAAAAAEAPGGSGRLGGALLISIAGSSHNTFAGAGGWEAGCCLPVHCNEQRTAEEVVY